MLCRTNNLIISIIMFVFICGFSSLRGGWQYRKEITINSTGAELTDYQVLVALTPTNFNYSNSDESDGHDLRFSTDSTGFTGQDIHYWIEEWVENDTSKIWLKIPFIPASGNKIVYLFYGNSSATKASNEDSTFLVYEDFSNDINEWTEYDPDAVITLDYGEDHRLEFNNWHRYNPGGVYKTYTPPESFLLDYDFNMQSGGGNRCSVGPMVGDSVGAWGDQQNAIYLQYWRGSGLARIMLNDRIGGLSNLIGEIFISEGTDYYARLKYIQKGDSTFCQLSIFSDIDRTTHISGSPVNSTVYLPNPGFKYFFTAVNPRWNAPTSETEFTTGWMDNYRLRNYAANEPIMDIATTEESGSWTLINIPSAPINLTAAPGNSQVTLTWTPNSESDLASYLVYGDTSPSPITLLSTIPAGTETYTHAGLTNGTTYYYRLSAVDNSGNESNESEVVSATPLEIRPLHFVQVKPTGLPYNIVIDSVSFTGFEFSLGDTLGFFDDTLCVGLAPVSQNFINGQKLNLVVWESATDYNLPGFTKGNSIRIAILSHYFGEREVFDPIPKYIIGDGSFGFGSYSSLDIGMAIDDVPLFEANNTNVSFGAVPIYESATETILISNNGTRNLVIKDIISNHSVFSTENYYGSIILPGESLLIQLHFSPSSVGSFTGELSIFYNNPENSPQRVGLTGIASQTKQPKMTGYSNTINMGEITAGDTVLFDWIVQNTGNDTLRVSDIYTNDYHFNSALSAFQLEPGGRITVPVQFAPDGKGLYSTSLYFSHNAPNVNQNWIDLFGVGYDGYFKMVQPTGLPYTIIVDSVSVDHMDLNYGEEIGVFADTLCVGVGVKGLAGNIQIVAWHEDENYNLPGFSTGDSISYKFWGRRYDENREIDLISDYDTGDGYFSYEPLSVVILSGLTGFSSSIKMSYDKIVFGTSLVNNDISQEIEITNVGNANLNISDIQFSSNVFFTNRASLSIPPDSTDILELFFQPFEAVNYIESMSIYYNDPLNSPLKINLEGLGLPLHQSQLKLPSPNLTFDPTIVGKSRTSSIFVKNDGNVPLSINSIISTSSDFNVEFFPVNISSGSIGTFPVTFIPSSKGMSTAKFQITSDNAGNGSTHYVYAKGVGYDGFFQPVPPTGVPYHIIIDSLSTFNESHLEIGDEIAVFDNDFCVGVGIVRNRQGIMDSQASISFDGNAGFQDYVETTINGFDTNIGSMELWVKINDTPTGDIPLLTITENNNWNPQAFHLMYRSGGTIHHHTYNNGWTGEWNIDNQWQNNTWHHLALTWNSSNRKIYLDGNLVGEDNNYVQPIIDPSTYKMRIGDNPDESFLNGNLDDIRLWGIELSQDDIQSRMNTALTGSEEGLIGYWPITSSETTIINDFSGHNNNGTLFGDVQITQEIPPITASLDRFAQLQITAWEKDDTYGLPGFTEGDSMLYLVRSILNDTMDSIPNIYLADPDYSSGDGYFGTGKLSASHLFVTDKEYSINIGLSETSLDIGEVQIDSVSTKFISIYNYGNFPLSVFHIKNNHPFFTLSDSSFVLSPNDSAMLTISFHATRIRTELDTIAIRNNDLDEEDQLKFIYLSATGIDTIGPHSPSDLVAIPLSKAITLNWKSSTDKDMNKYLVHRGIESVSDSVVAEVYFPDTTFTDYDAIQNVEYYYYLTPVDTLNNKGKSSSVVSATPILRHIVLSEDYLDFGSVQVDSTTTLTFTIRSWGNQSLNILNMDFIGDEFTISDTTANLSSVDTITLTITLKPKRPKAIMDTLFIYNDDVDLEDQVKKISLSGMGMDTIPPMLPTGVSSFTAPKQITIEWASNQEPDLEKYLIHRGIDAPDSSVIAEVFSPDTIFFDTDVHRDIQYYYYVTAVDTVGNISAASDTIMALAVNSPPELTAVNDLSREVHGNIQLQFLVEDVENDTIVYGFYFSTDSINWGIPTLTDISDTNTVSIVDTLEFIWISEEDLGKTDVQNVYFKIEAYDFYDTTVFISDRMSIDNYVGKLSIITNQGMDEYSNIIDFSYVIIDTTNDHYDLLLSYSVDEGYSWEDSESWTILDSTMYDDTLKWNSLIDLLNYDGEIKISISLNDGWQYGIGDTIDMNLDNQFLPNIIDVELANYCFDPIRFTFNKEINFESLQDGFSLSSRHGIYESYQLDYDMSSYIITIQNATGWFAGDSLDIELTPHITDSYGNPFDGNGNDDPDSTGDSLQFTIPINLLGDFDDSDGVNFTDLLTFQQLWLSDSLEVTDEVGPAVGLPPYYQFLPDNKFDFEDLMVFVQMWNWTAGFDYGGGNSLAKTILSTGESLTLNTDYTDRENGQKYLKISLSIPDIINVGALEFKVQYDTSDVKFLNTSSSNDNSWVILSHNDGNNGRLTVNMADLKKEVRTIRGSPLTLSFIGLKDQESDLLWQADIRNRKGGIKEIVSGTYKFNTFAPVPEVYALHQNYPNPFNPTTTIRYDLPEETQVYLVIYNLLGQEVIKLVNKTQTAGFYSITWDSKNAYGKIVSPGIYFYLLKTNDYSSTRKLILLK